MMILLPTACWMIGVSGWKLNHSVTLMASLPTAGVMVLQPGPGAGKVPSPPRGPFGVPLPAVLGSVMKIHPVFGAGTAGEPCGTPPLGSGPLGQAGLLARFMITAWPAMAVATSVSDGHWCGCPFASTKYDARTATRAPSLAACCRVM